MKLRIYHIILQFLHRSFGKGFVHVMEPVGKAFIVVTGMEILYADVGHFGPKAIRICWFTLVLPSLLLCYLGIGALILGNHEAKVYPVPFLISKENQPVLHYFASSMCLIMLFLSAQSKYNLL